MAVNDRTLALILAQRRELAAITDAQARDITAAWARAFDEINADMQAAITDMLADAGGDAARVSRIVRLRKANAALKIAADQLQRLAQASGVRISDDAVRVINAAVGGQAALVISQLPPGFTTNLLRVDAGQMQAIVERTTQQITARHYALSQEATAAMKRELLRSIPIGDNPRTAARNIVNRVEGRFNGGLTRALTIARTESLDAYRTAAQRQQQTNADVLGSWQWVASLSARTCPACLSLHGSRHPLEEPGPEGHQNCRCARVPVTKTWRELGIDLDEAPSVLPDGGVWFNSQPAETQRKILGPTRYEAWRAGGYPREAWAVKRHTPGWRDSWVPSPVPRSIALAS